MGTPALDKTMGKFVQLATLPTGTLIRAKFRYLSKSSFHDETLLQAVVDLIGEA